MRNIRFGKDIATRWRVRTNGENAPLENRDLHLFLTDQFGDKTELPFVIDDVNIVSFMWWGKDHRRYGHHIVTLYENLGVEGQTCVDAVDYVNLVEYTTQETDATSDNLSLETVDLEGDLTITSRGMNNYELWLLDGHEGTLSDFLEWSRGPQGEPGEDGKSLTFDDLTDVQKEQLKGKQGEPGKDGLDAKINGVNILRIVSGANMQITQSGSTMTFEAIMREASVLRSQLAYDVQNTLLAGQMAYNAVSGLDESLRRLAEEKYTKPVGGIPESDLSLEVRDKLDSGGGGGAKVAVEDSLTSDSGTDALSARQGKVLKGLVDGKASQQQVDIMSGNMVSLKNDLDGKASSGALSDLADEVSGKQDVISDLAAIRNGAALGATAVQPSDIKEVARTGSYDDLSDKPSIPMAITEEIVSGWGFTKNQGTYSKPSGGIPKTDLAADVQTSLGKADTALQAVPSTYRLASAQDAIDAGKQDVIPDLSTIRNGAALGATALQSYTETDPVFAASPAKGITSANITSWNAKADKPSVVTTLPSTLAVNTFYNLGTITGTKTIALPSSRTAADEFMLQFTTGSTVPTVNWPSAVTWLGGTPTLSPSKTYQVSIQNNLGIIAEF